jgi:peptide subunit release factor RF-3
MNFKVARWPAGEFDPEQFRDARSTKLVQDREGRWVLLFEQTWSLNWIREKYPDLELRETGLSGDS